MEVAEADAGGEEGGARRDNNEQQGGQQTAPLEDEDLVCQECNDPEDVQRQRIAPTPYLPTQSEIEDHRCTHIPSGDGAHTV